MRFWLNKGVAGFRLDALKFMYETTNTTLNDPDVSQLNLYNGLQEMEGISFNKIRKKEGKLRVFSDNKEELILKKNQFK